MARKEKEKKHFRTEEWVDFANKQLSLEQMETMQGHLETGCERCSKLSEIWRRVSEAAKRESEFEAPESAVRHVRNAFAILAEPKRRSRVFEIPRLVFDSLWQPALVGVRSAPNAPRHLLYRAGRVAIELRLEVEHPSDRVNIAGQVCSTATHGEGLAKVPVVVCSSKKKVVEATTTNRHGEFQLSFAPEEGLRMSFDNADGKELSIPLDGTGMMTLFRH